MRIHPMRMAATMLTTALVGVAGFGAMQAGAASATTQPAATTLPVDTTIAVDPSATTAPAPPAIPTITTLPLFGTQLTLDITTGPGGALANIAVNPADGLTAVELHPNEVVFVDAAGTTQVVVKSRGGGQRVEAKSGSLDDFTAGGGAGGWSGDVFGTGAATTVGFNVVKNADGSPDITGITSSDPTAEIGAVEHESEDSEMKARAAVRFTSGAQSRTLFIKVTVATEDGATQARVSVSLSRLKGVAVPAADAAGPHQWVGQLCDGSAARIDYTVDTSGTVSGVTASPTTASVNNNDHGIEVRFSEIERVRIRVRQEDGQIKISVSERFRCDSPDPTVNTPISTTTEPGDEGDDNHNGDHQGDKTHGDRGGRRTTTTTETGAATPDSTTPDSTRSGRGNRGGGNNGGGNGDGNNGGGNGSSDG